MAGWMDHRHSSSGRRGRSGELARAMGGSHTMFVMECHADQGGGERGGRSTIRTSSPSSDDIYCSLAQWFPAHALHTVGQGTTYGVEQLQVCV